MKILPYLLLNVVVVAAGIVVYDQVREDTPTQSVLEGGSDALDEERLVAQVVERLGDKQPALVTSGTDPRVVARILALEKAMATRPGPRPAASDAPAATSDAPLASAEQPADVEEPGDEEVARFRRLMERAEQARRDEREQKRLEDTLKRLEIKLTPDQKTKLMASMRKFRSKMGETMRAAFQGGGGREAAREAMDGLRQELSVEMQEYMSIGDVQKITESSAGLMRGFGGFGRGRGGGGR